jgi:Na+-transporting methylmalonyl-CoA/oxaloacetate decarboxylase gamma subunit
MSSGHIEVATARSTPGFTRWKLVMVEGITLCLAALFLLAIPIKGLESAIPQSSPQEAPSPARPQAQSEQERVDFNTAYALQGAATEEAAAIDFSNRYPTSQLRRHLYTSAMLQYQRENNPAKMLAMGERVLALDPDNPLALVLTATAQANSLVDHDRDRDKKVSTIRHNASRAIQAAEAGYSGETIYKTTLQSMAYSALGIMKLKTGDDAGAEKDLKMATELAKIRPDGYSWYHLALAQDHRKKYAAALGSVEQALQLASSDPELQKLAEVEHERLAGLARGPRNTSSTEPQ